MSTQFNEVSSPSKLASSFKVPPLRPTGIYNERECKERTPQSAAAESESVTSSWTLNYAVPDSLEAGLVIDPQYHTRYAGIK